jgi:hypothetical protein
MGHAGIEGGLAGGKRVYAEHKVDGHDALVRRASIFTHPRIIPQGSTYRATANTEATLINTFPSDKLVVDGLSVCTPVSSSSVPALVDPAYHAFPPLV